MIPKLSPYHGWLVVDKPLGVTSADVVHIARRALKMKKIGHAGTLDPLASGVLPLALGEGTKTIPYAVDGEKIYRFCIKFGAETETDDAEGTVTQQNNVRPMEKEIRAVLPRFLGEIQQVPPIYSALKVDGKRAYALARAGEEVVLAARPVHIYALRFESMRAPDEVELVAKVGKGTYIRALARDIARTLGAWGHVSYLRREAVGNFTLEGAILLDFLEKSVHKPETLQGLKWLQPMELALGGIPAHTLTDAEYRAILQGQKLEKKLDCDGLIRLMFNEKLAALAEANAGRIWPKRVFNYK